MRTIIKLIHAVFFIFSSFSFLFSQGNTCVTAYNFGNLPAPSGCGSPTPGVGSTVSHNGTNVGATAANPYVYIPDCGTGTIDMAVGALDVWYTFVATGASLRVNVTGTLVSPNLGLYSGSCSNLSGIGCAIGTAGGAITNVVFEPLVIGQTYFIQVSGNNSSSTGNFELTLNNNNDCSDCMQNSLLTANPLPVNGTYGAGQTVTFCYQINNYTQVSSNWLHGVQVSWGSGWVTTPSNVVTSSPASCSGSGNWAWYPTGIGTVNGTSWGAGFYYDYTSGVTGPQNNYGDYNAQNCDPTFCFTLTTPPIGLCTPGASLSVNVNTSSDGESGSWTSIACQDDPISNFEAVLNCCSPPSMTSTTVTCFGGTDGTATATAQGTTSPWDFEWRNSQGTIVSSTLGSLTASNPVTGLPVGTYTVTVTDNNGCVSSNTVTIIQNSSATVTVPANISVCHNSLIPATNFVSNPAGAIFSWTNSDPTIGILGSGTGNIAQFTALNTGLNPITSTITVVPIIGSCAGIPNTYTITINPAPNVVITGNSTICIGTSTTLTGSFSPVPVSSQIPFINSTSVHIGGNNDSGTGTIALNSSGIQPTTLSNGQIVSVCFIVKHQDISELNIISLNVGGTIYNNTNTPALQTLLTQIQSSPDNSANPFCIPSSLLNTISGNSNTTWSISLNDGTVAQSEGGDILELEVIINNTPSVNYTWSPSATLSGTTSGTTTSSPLTISATPTNSPTTYTLSVTGSTGCVGTGSFEVVTTSPITPSFNTFGPYCQNDPSVILPTNSNDLPAINGIWNVSSINTSNIGITQYTFTPNANQCANPSTITINITTPITPSFNQLGPFCQNSSPVNLPLSSTNSIIGTWSPNVINTSIIGGTLYNFTPTAGQCASATNMTISVSTPINPTFNQLGPFCENSSPATLSTNSNNSVSGTWNPNVISTNITGQSLYTFTPNAGICANQATMTVTVNQNSTPTFTQLGDYCQNGIPGTLPANSTNSISGAWTPNLITTASAGQTTYNFTPTVGLCALPTSMTITVNPLPSFTTTVSQQPTICGATDGIITLSGLVNSTNYSLTYSDGSVITGPFGIQTTNTGTYSITNLNAGTYSNFIISTGLCSTTVVTPLSLSDPNAPTFTVTFGSNPTTCQGTNGSLIINGLLPSTTYQLSYNFGSNQIGPNIITTNASGVFTISNLSAGAYSGFIINLSGCQGTQNNTIFLTEPNVPILQITNPLSVCTPSTIDLTNPSITVGSSNVTSLSYWLDINATFPLSNPTSVNSSGTYFIQATNSGCSDIEAVQVTINFTPVITNPGSQTSCLSYVLPDLSGNQNYYNNSQTNNGNQISGVINNTQTVWIYETNNGCSSEVSFLVTINPEPILTSLTGDGTYCIGDNISPIQVELSGQSPYIVSYSINGGASVITNSNQPIINLGTSPGVYSILSIEDANCTNTSVNSTASIVINPIPNAPLVSSGATYCYNETANSLVASGQGTFTWYNDSGLNSIVSTNSSYTPTSTIGTFLFYATQTENGCESEASVVTITFTGCEIEISTAFTPDDDNVNDIWTIENIDDIYPKNKVKIFNRWGSLLFESNEGAYQQNPWDGKHNGENLPIGSYYYIIEYNDNVTKASQGTVSIIK